VANSGRGTTTPELGRDAEPGFSIPRTRVEVPAPETASAGIPAQRRRVAARRAVGPPRHLGARHYLTLVLRYKVLILAVGTGTMLCTALRLLLQPPGYMASATILPSAGQGNVGVLGLIASFTGGAPLGGMSEESSSFLFPSMLQSRSVGIEVLQAKYRFQADGRDVERTLEEHLKAENTDRALKILHQIVAIDVHKETGMITVAATTLHPELSAQIVNRFVDSLERLSLEMRRSSATLNSTFIQERLDQSLRELREAEQRLTVFRERNLRMSSPDLELERMRLERDVEIKSQVYLTLSNQAEIARIEEAKDLPVVRVLDRASVPVMPVPVPRLSSLLLGAIAGALLAIAAVAGAEVAHFLRRELHFCRQALARGGE
jgi:uncharacterized protein involved in exopolysaccharide biosynthesis